MYIIQEQEDFSIKIPPFKIDNEQELEFFRDTITTLWNYGKYPISIGTSIPTWKAQPGEKVLFRPASGGMTEYVYVPSAWLVLVSSTT